MAEDSFSLLELITGIATVHSGASTFFFKILCSVCSKTLLSCKIYFGAEKCHFSAVPLRNPGSINLLRITCLLSCSGIALGITFWANSSVADHSKSWQADKKLIPGLCPLYLKEIYPTHFMCTGILCSSLHFHCNHALDFKSRVLTDILEICFLVLCWFSSHSGSDTCFWPDHPSPLHTLELVFGSF